MAAGAGVVLAGVLGVGVVAYAENECEGEGGGEEAFHERVGLSVVYSVVESKTPTRPLLLHCTHWFKPSLSLPVKAA